MRDSRDSDGAVLVIAVVMVLVLLAGGGGLFMWLVWQRQAALMQRERAVAEAARARAVAERRLVEANQAEPTMSEQPTAMDDDPNSMEASIRQVLQTQQLAWNAGDIDQFMESYWKSEDLTFSSGGKLTRTWRGTLESYKERYPSRRDMGKLSFLNLDVTPLGVESALVLGEWQLSRVSLDLGGNFTLVFRRLGDKWVIVHDHTPDED